MGYDITVTKGYGFTVPLADFEDEFDSIEAQLQKKHRSIIMGMSGSSTISGVNEEDVVWVAPRRLVDEEEPGYSEGFAWNFRKKPTEAERTELQEVAAALFGLSEPPLIEPFVVLEAR